MNQLIYALMLSLAVASCDSTPNADGGSAPSDAALRGDAGAPGTDAGHRQVACPSEPVLDQPFASAEGVAPNLLSLNAYPTPFDGPAPVLLFVHGGGWTEGDKANVERAASFLPFFHEEGWAVVSINYRLLGDEGSRDATWDDQPADVAAATAWVVEHADELCLDPDRIVLLGHSAGAHLVALVATDPSYLAAHGLDPSLYRGVISMDVNAYDVPWAIDNGAALGVPGAPANLRRIFSDDPIQQRRASPMTHLSSERRPPPFLVIWAPVFHGLTQTLSQVASERFVGRLSEVGAQASIVASLDDDHTELAIELGRPGDVPTQEIRAFLLSL